MPIPVDSGCILVDSGLIPEDSSGIRWNPVIPAGMVGGVTSTGRGHSRNQIQCSHANFFFFTVLNDLKNSCVYRTTTMITDSPTYCYVPMIATQKNCQ